MASKHQHSEAEWLRHRDEICRLYVDEGLKLQTLMEHMELQNFHATVQQYKKRFKKWGISKSIKKSEWAGIASDVTTQLQRRGNAAGSKLDITFKGRAIPPKRLATALARYYPQLKLQKRLLVPDAPSVGEPPQRRSPSPIPPFSDLDLLPMDLDEDVMDVTWDDAHVQLPGTSSDGHVASLHVCNELLSPAIEQFHEGSAHPWWPEIDTSQNLSNMAICGRSRSRSPVSQSPLGSAATDFSPEKLIDWRFYMVRNLPFFDFQRKLDDLGFGASAPGARAIEELAGATSSAGSVVQQGLNVGRTLLDRHDTTVVHKCLLHVLLGPKEDDFQRAIRQYNEALVLDGAEQFMVATVRGYIPERSDGYVAAMVRSLQDPSQAVRQIFEISAYLLSNNLAGESQFTRIIDLIRIPRYRRQILAFMTLEEYSARAITTGIIDSAIRIDASDVIRDLHAQGFRLTGDQLAECCSKTADVGLLGVLLRSMVLEGLLYPHRILGCRLLAHVVDIGTPEVARLAVKVFENHRPPCLACQQNIAKLLVLGDGAPATSARNEHASESEKGPLESFLSFDSPELVSDDSVFPPREIEVSRPLSPLSPMADDFHLLAPKSIATPPWNWIFNGCVTASPPSSEPYMLNYCWDYDSGCDSDCDSDCESDCPHNVSTAAVPHGAERTKPRLVPCPHREACESDCPDRGLASAVLHGAETVERLLGSGREFSSRDIKKAFWAALELNDVPIVRLLLDIGADPNARCYRYAGRLRSRLPLDIGADTNARRYTLFGRLRRVEERDSGKEISASLHRAAPLHIAALRGYCQMVGVLLSRGAESDVLAECCISNNHLHLDLTPLQLAAIGSHIEIATCLDKGADVDKRVKWIPTALTLAARVHEVEMMTLLLDRGADVNKLCYIPTWGGWSTTVRAAVCERHDRADFKLRGEEVVRLLLDKGANINSPPPPLRLPTTETPLQALICHHASLETLRLALDAGADVSISVTRTPKARLKLTTGLRDDLNLTTLQWACLYGGLEVAELVLDYGADINGIASGDHGVNTLELFINRRVPDLALVEMLIRRGVDVNAKSRFDKWRTPLQMAAANGHVPIAQALLEAGADVNAISSPGRHGMTAIDEAACCGRLDMVQLLLEYGAVGSIDDMRLLRSTILRARYMRYRAICSILEVRQHELLTMPPEDLISSFIQTATWLGSKRPSRDCDTSSTIKVPAS